MRRAQLGDVFTSERAVALLLRWHVFRPGHVVDTQVGQKIRDVVNRATSIWTSVPSLAAWTDTDEARLLTELMVEVNNGDWGTTKFPATMVRVRDWPQWAAAGAGNPRGYALSPTIGNLAVTRNSFNFDGTDLPPAP